MISTIHDKLLGYIENRDISGASIMVRKHGEIVHEEYLGLSDIARNKPISPDDMFRLASMTKPVIAVAIMMMAERGKLSIKDEIAKYIPEFAEMQVAQRLIPFSFDADMECLMEQAEGMAFEPLERPIIIEDLLRHRSGLGQGIVSEKYGVNNTSPGMTLDERMRVIAACPMDFQPGKCVGYSALVAFDILGRILEIVSGKDLETLLREMIFDPLKMTDMTFAPTQAQKDRTVRMYGRATGDLSDIAAPGEFSSPFYFSFPSGSAGLIGTLRDYDRFVQMLGNGGELDGVRILKEETVRLMAAPCPEDPPKAFPGSAWGLGMNIFSAYPVSHRHLSEGTFGWSGAFGTHFYIDPANDVTMVLMLNRADIGGADSYVSFGMEEAIFKGLNLH